MQRTTVLILFGGESSEHDVSISSARNVYAAIDDAKFTVLLGYIDQDGKWWLIDSFGEEITTHGAPQLVAVLGSKSFVTFPDNKIVRPDVILPILHGKNGEDGSVQGLAQLLHIPIVGCGMNASVLAMDKLAAKEIVSQHDITVVPYISHREGDPVPDFSQLSMKLGSPMFVKPTRAGSSVGVGKIYSEDELIVALENAHIHDKVALVERGISGREVEVAILGNTPDHRMSDVGEIRVSGDFYSYESKYSSSSTSEVIIPAEMSEQTREKIRNDAGKVYSLLGCSGLARVDFFLADDNTIYFNEINTLPGFTNISMYPKLWRSEGISYSELIEKLINTAIQDTIKIVEVTEDKEQQWTQ